MQHAVANSTIKMLFDTTMPVIMMTPISDMMLNVLSVSEQNHHYPCQARRDSHQDDERIDKRAELRHQNQVNQCDGDQQAEAKRLNDRSC